MKILSRILLILLISYSAKSQDFEKEKTRKFGLSHSVGLFADHFAGMDYDMITNRSEEMISLGYNLDGMKVLPLYKTVVSTYAGVALNAEFVNSRGITNEFSVGVNIVPTREPMMEYGAVSDDNPNRSVVFCIMESEVNIEASYLRQFSFSTIKRLKINIGPSVNVGRTFNNEFILISETISDSEIRSNSQNNYVYSIPVGDGNYDQNGNWSGQYSVFEEQRFDAQAATMLRLRLNLGIQYDFSEHWSVSTQFMGGQGWQQIPNWGTEEFYNFQTNVRGVYWF